MTTKQILCPYCGGEATFNTNKFASIHWFACENPECNVVVGSNDIRALYDMLKKRNTHGERICINDSLKPDLFLCSECQAFYSIARLDIEVDDDTGIPNYCPNCDAKVVGVDV